MSLASSTTVLSRQWLSAVNRVLPEQRQNKSQGRCDGLEVRLKTAARLSQDGFAALTVHTQTDDNPVRMSRV
jgi:hypothetical protein